MPNHFGRFGRVDPHNPEAAGICDRGGEVRKLRDLMPEMHWAGGRLVPNGFRVCREHMDVPNPQFGGQRPLRPDPVPVRNPRPPHDPADTSAHNLQDAAGAPWLDTDGQPVTDTGA